MERWDVGVDEVGGDAGCGRPRSAGSRRRTGVDRPAGRVASVGVVPDPELVERPRRRRFSAEYKLRIVREADACSRPGEIGALLRREGLYSTLLTEWRRARDSGALVALGPKTLLIGADVSGAQARSSRIRAGAADVFIPVSHAGFRSAWHLQDPAAPDCPSACLAHHEREDFAGLPAGPAETKNC